MHNKIYTEEQPYYNLVEEKILCIHKEYNEILENLENIQNRIDIICSITYPYNMNLNTA
jgi:hypothetical protein